MPKKSQGSWLEAAQDVLDARTLLSKHKPGREALPLLTNWLASSWASQLKAGEWLARHNADVFGWRHDRQMLAWLFLSEHPIATAQELIPFLPLMNTNSRSYDLGTALEAVKKALDVSTNVNVEPALEILLPIKYQLEPQSDSYDYIPRMLSVGPTRGVSELNWILHVTDPNGIYQALYNLEKGPAAQLPGAARTLAWQPVLPDRAIPLLITNLHLPGRHWRVYELCALALGKYGEKAASSLPGLTNLLANPQEEVRLAASNAIVSINAARSPTISQQKGVR